MKEATKQKKSIFALLLVTGLFIKNTSTPIIDSIICGDDCVGKLYIKALTPPHAMKTSGFDNPEKERNKTHCVRPKNITEEKNEWIKVRRTQTKVFFLFPIHWKQLGIQKSGDKISEDHTLDFLTDQGIFNRVATELRKWDSLITLSHFDKIPWQSNRLFSKGNKCIFAWALACTKGHTNSDSSRNGPIPFLKQLIQLWICQMINKTYFKVDSR